MLRLKVKKAPLIPEEWKQTEVIFKPKEGKNGNQKTTAMDLQSTDPHKYNRGQRIFKVEEEQRRNIPNEQCGLREEHLTEYKMITMIENSMTNIVNRRTTCMQKKHSLGYGKTDP